MKFRRVVPQSEVGFNPRFLICVSSANATLMGTTDKNKFQIRTLVRQAKLGVSDWVKVPIE